MTNRAWHQIAIDDENGRPVAAADVQLVGTSTARATLHVEHGQLPVGTRTQLVDAVLDLPELRSRRQLQLTVPMGDHEMLHRVRERCGAVHARAAGTTCLIDADLHPALT